jgi:hypothetical protein
MLLVERTGRLYRTIFESINCSPSATLAALHP